tara:strand:- start:588 stop:944 length:357 start_codon:yes stop_codon:yes gene_type:complete
MIDMDDNEFGVLLRPIISEDDEDKYGNVEVAVFSNLMPAVDDEVHARYMFLAYKMASMLQFCEDNPDVDDRLEAYTEALIDKLGLMEEEEEPEAKPKVTGREGNVITLDFNTKCEGEG